MNNSKHVKKILNDGYTVIKNVLGKEECKKIKEICKKNYLRYTKLTKIKNPREQTIYNLHNKNDIFLKFIAHKKTFGLAEKLLSIGSYKSSGEIILRQTAARNPLKGNSQQLHNDTRLVGCKYPLVVHMIYMLDDFTKENGATRIVPKSHKRLYYAKNNKIYKDEVLITGKKGSVLIFDASLWHGSSIKTIDEERWGMVFSYSRWFLKPDFDHCINTPKKIYNKLSLFEKSLLGFNSTPRKDEFDRPSARSIKPLKPKKYNLPI